MGLFQRCSRQSGHMEHTLQKNRLYIRLYKPVDDDREEALRVVNNPRGETLYDVVRYIRWNYHNIKIKPGLGENQIAQFLRMVSKAKGYTKGQPDLILICKDGTNTDVTTMRGNISRRLKSLSHTTRRIHELLHDVNVPTYCNNKYTDRIGFIDNHYEHLRRCI